MATFQVSIPSTFIQVPGNHYGHLKRTVNRIQKSCVLLTIFAIIHLYVQVCMNWSVKDANLGHFLVIGIAISALITFLVTGATTPTKDTPVKLIRASEHRKIYSDSIFFTGFAATILSTWDQKVIDWISFPEIMPLFAISFTTSAFILYVLTWRLAEKANTMLEEFENDFIGRSGKAMRRLGWY